MHVADPPPARALADREIMLHCLAAAAETERGGDFGLGAPARRMLELRLRTTATRRAAAAQRDEARAMREVTMPSCEGWGVSDAVLSRLSLDRIVLDLYRADLWVHRSVAAGLRSDARALRAEAAQMRLHSRRSPS